MQNRKFHTSTEVDPGLISFAPLWVQGRKYFPSPGDRHALLWLQHEREVKVSFTRAFAGWRAAGFCEREDLGEGRAFLRWMQKRKISIEWKPTDFHINPLFSGPEAPKHDPADEFAQNHSFAIRPVSVKGRHIKLYVQDQDMLGLLNLPYGEEEDFLKLVGQYVTQRFIWERWKAPAPCFLDWVRNRAKRPRFSSGQLGFTPPMKYA